MDVRKAEHAGSWYSNSKSQLTAQLDEWLAQVPSDIPGIGNVPIAGARVVISPHAGYSYSGAAAAWAYKCLDLRNAKRIFILHPSHHHHLSTAALPVCTAYATPLSRTPLPLDLDTIRTLSNLTTKSSQGRDIKFNTMSQTIDEAEHSGEMQLPYIHRLLQLAHPNQAESSYPPLIPIMIGSTNPATEAALGKLLAPYIADSSNIFIISSDFCHWGSRFGYTYYLPSAPHPALDPSVLPHGVSKSPHQKADNTTLHLLPTLSQGLHLRSSKQVPTSGPPIYCSIAHVDRACMCAIATGEHSQFLAVLQDTGNTICGRHPIGVFMAGLEEVERLAREQGRELEEERRRFRFTRYERSSDVQSVGDSSVSYVSAFVVL